MDCSREGRGQLVLVVALVLAALFIGVALTVNTVIFTENLATRSDDPKVLPDRQAAKVSVTDGIRHLNEHNEANRSYATLHEELRNVTGETSRALQRSAGVRGASISMEVVAVDNGTRIKQTNHNRNFTAGDDQAGGKTWSVVEDVSETPVFWQNVSRLGLAAQSWGTTQAVMANSSYHIAITQPGVSGVWRVYIFQGAATKKVYVVSEPPSENYRHNTDAHIDWIDACSYTTEEWVRIDIEEGLMGGAPCKELEFFTDLNDGYDIYYNQTAATVAGTTVDRTKGTYELFVRNAPIDQRPYYRASTDKSPFSLTALYQADLAYKYSTDELTYQGRLRARPARLNAASNTAPTIDPFDIHDNVDTDLTSDENYTVDWAVSDSGGLEKVQLILSENATGTQLDMVNISSVSGTTASGTTELDHLSLAEGATYDIWILATDTEGRTEIRRVVDTADSTDP